MLVCEMCNRNQIRIRPKQWNDLPTNNKGICNRLEAAQEYIHITNGKEIDNTHIIKQRKIFEIVTKKASVYANKV